MIYPLHYATVLLGCALVLRPLARGRWAWRAPRVALVVWQSLGLAGVLSAIGLVVSVGLAPYRLGAVPAAARFVGDLVHGPAHRLETWQVPVLVLGFGLAGWIGFAIGQCTVDVVRARRRHRRLLSLVGRSDPAVGEALVIDHPAAAAYCLPGWPASVVVSTGTIRMLDHDQLYAVLAHERAHASERHHLVLLPFTALHRAFRRSAVLTEVRRAVELLLEMCADDRAARQYPARSLATALLEFRSAGHGGAPDGALAAAAGQVGARIARLLDPEPPPPLALRLLTVVLAVAAAATPVSLFVLPVSAGW